MSHPIDLVHRLEAMPNEMLLAIEHYLSGFIHDNMLHHPSVGATATGEEKDLILRMVDGLNSCTTEAFPDYNPNYFDGYCSSFEVCLRFWNQDNCTPSNAYGMTYQQSRVVTSVIIGIPTLIAWLFIGYLLVPFYACMYVTNNLLHTCTFGLFANNYFDENGNEIAKEEQAAYALGEFST